MKKKITHTEWGCFTETCRTHVDPFSLTSKWKDFQASPSKSYASKPWLPPFACLLHWQDPGIAPGSLMAGSTGQHSALTLRHQALGMNLPISWCRSLTGTQRDRKKCGRTLLPYHDTPSIWGAETHPQEQVMACCFAKLLSKKVILISMEAYIFFNAALTTCQALPKPLITLPPLTLNNHSVRWGIVILCFLQNEFLKGQGTLPGGPLLQEQKEQKCPQSPRDSYPRVGSVILESRDELLNGKKKVFLLPGHALFR